MGYISGLCPHAEIRVGETEVRFCSACVPDLGGLPAEARGYLGRGVSSTSSQWGQ